MAVVNAPGRTVRIAGQQRAVLFTINRLIEVEERYGTIEKASEAMQQKPLSAVRFMLWVGAGKPTETEAEFGDLDVDDGLQDAITKVGAAFAEATYGPPVQAAESNGAGPTKLETVDATGPSS